MVKQGSFINICYLVMQGREMMTVRSQLLKGILDGCVLAILEKESVYGYVLSQKLQQVGLDDVSEGTIYPVLLRLQKNNYIVGEMRPSEAGPNRKYYTLTKEGMAALQTIRTEWEQVAKPITKLLRGKDYEFND